MLKKFSTILLVLMLATGLAFIGCGGGGGTTIPPPGDAFEFDGPFTYHLWGDNQPTIEGQYLVFNNVSGSMGFYLRFADMGYTLNRGDTLIFTYSVEVTTPLAVLTLKQQPGWTDVNANMTNWGRGGGREYVLGHPVLSNFEEGDVGTIGGTTSPALVNATWDAATSTGTFEVRMATFEPNATAIGFQHNFWSDMGGENAANSNYRLRILRVENVTDDAILAPVIETQPTGMRIQMDATVTQSLTVVADEVPEGATRTYQWQIYNDGWTAITGATNATLALADHVATAAPATFSFRVVVTNVRGEETPYIISDAANVVVYDPAAALTWEDVYDFGWFYEIWSSGAIDITVLGNGIEFVVGGGAVRFDVDAVREAVGLDPVGPPATAVNGRLVRLIVEITDGDELLNTSGQGSGHTTSIMYNANNGSNPPNDPWIRFVAEALGTFVVTDIQVATVDGWADNDAAVASLTSVFDLLGNGD